jgi:hypothetical protein
MLQNAPRSLARALIILVLGGFLLALFGTYWDDAWHTEEGRDSFLSPPHIALYAGISMAGAAAAAWAMVTGRREGWRTLLRYPPLLLALIGVSVALASAPIDNGWHLAFGRDAVLWSPPHMLGVAGNFALASALLLEFSRLRSRPGEAAALLAAAAVLAIAVVPVLEYETDVPQFDLAFYLPVLTLGSAFAFALVRAVLRSPWPATSTALAYTAIMALVAGVLELSGLPGPLIGLLTLPGAVLDLAGQRRWPLPIGAGAYTVALYAAYVPYLNWVRGDVFLELADVAVGLPLALAASLVGLGIGGLARGASPRWALAALACSLPLLFPPSALGHDPGQGEEVMRADLVGRSSGSSARLAVTLPSRHCRDTEPRRIIARRAGEEISGSLSRQGSCRLRGSVPLPERGRWFVYGELEHEGELLETWLPLHAGERETRREPGRSVYLPPDVDDPLIKPIAGVAIYLLVTALLLAVPLIYRRRPLAAV